MMNPYSGLQMTRRHFFSRSAQGLGVAALGHLLKRDLLAEEGAQSGALGGLPHFAPKAKRVIYLFQSGGPSHLELFDYKPVLRERAESDLPASVMQGKRVTSMTSFQARFPLVPSQFEFAQHGESGAWVSELMPYTAQVVDELCFIKSLHGDQINHDPAVTFMQTGFQLAGRPSLGSWVSYGLGSENEDLPTFVVMISGTGDQPLYDRLWGSGFVPSRHQGVKLRSVGDPVLDISDPQGFDREHRRQFIDQLQRLNQITNEEYNDPEIATRIAQYEMAFRMQRSVPELTDLSEESESTFELYGEDSRRKGSFASNCLLARRLAERDVRFIQIYHRGWDQHQNLPSEITKQAKIVDQGSAALIQDLKNRGMLEDTLVIWGGEFGRTAYCQGKLTPTDYGRDHHPYGFTMWLAGGGVRPGVTYGATDEFGYNAVEDPVHVHDLNATILNQLGIDHTRLTYRFQGRNFRLTDVGGRVVRDILA